MERNTATQQKPTVNKLLPRHTEAGIEISYDDHILNGIVCLRRNGQLLSRSDETGRHVAVWTGPVTVTELVAEADHYLPQATTHWWTGRGATRTLPPEVTA